MSPAQKSKSKTSAKMAKDNAPAKLPSVSNPGNGSLGGSFGPLSGTVDEALNSENSGRFKNFDESEDHSGSSLGTNGECDSVSTNGSCSGESEDQKEKSTVTVPKKEHLPVLDSSKREKIRQKNERKHQRQKERRTQELHERCSVYLMSRKLEALAQQLVAMGFSSEQATMALIQNEGRLEESVTWLFEGGEDSKQPTGTDLQSAANLKIDITDELAMIAVLECKLLCTKQEVERAVVNCEGDLVKAEEMLKQKQESAPSQNNAPPKLEESANFATTPNKTVLVAQSQNVGAVAKGINVQPQREFTYDSKPQLNASIGLEPVNKNMQQPFGRLATNLDRSRLQAPSLATAVIPDKRWPNVNSMPSSPSPVAIPPVVPPLPTAKAEARFSNVGLEPPRSSSQFGLRGPITVMPRPQSINSKPSVQSLPSTSIGYSTSPPGNGWYPNGLTGMEMRMSNVMLGHDLTGSGMSGSVAHPQYVSQNHFRTMGANPMQGGLYEWENATAKLQSSLSLQSSLGLMAAERGARPSMLPAREWTGNPPPAGDYTNIDWSLDAKLLNPSARSDLLSDTWTTLFMGGKVGRRSATESGDGYISEFQDSGLPKPSSAELQDWTSPFSAGDLLRASRNLVTSPTLL